MNEKVDLLRDTSSEDIKLLMKSDEGQDQVLKHIKFLNGKIFMMKRDAALQQDLYDEIYSQLTRLRHGN